MTVHTVISTSEIVRSGFPDPSAKSLATIASGDVVSYPNTRINGASTRVVDCHLGKVVEFVYPDIY
jgi:hypothetical protein